MKRGNLVNIQLIINLKFIILQIKVWNTYLLILISLEI